MKLLLDTHILVWALLKDRRLTSKAQQLIQSPRNTIVVSSASIWEIAVKRAAGKIEVEPAEAKEAVIASGFEPLDVTGDHAVQVAALPTYHRDPFDQMLVAQCIVETAHLLTHDATLSRYGKMVLLV